MNILADSALHADRLARQLATPRACPGRPRQAQSLAAGAAGVAMLHIERALAGTGSWKTAHLWVKAATRRDLCGDDSAGLYVGAPAVAFVLHTAGADGTVRYAPALAGLDVHVTALAHRRVDRALARIARSERPAFAEYDLLHGLTGIGAHLLQHAPGSDAFGRILGYLVRLSEPLRADGEYLPGWWTFHDPNLQTVPGGHANFGMAHGISGPLALMSLASRHGITVSGQEEAISRVCAWLDTWRQTGTTGTWWPQWITRQELRTQRTRQPGPGRPSWCYGTPGIARAQQLAAIATGDSRRRRMAEDAMASCLTDPVQLGQITDAGLCHGWAGVYQTTMRTAGDALTPGIGGHLPLLMARLSRNGTAADRECLLEGAAGLALALHAAARAAPPISGWDTCLMIS